MPESTRRPSGLLALALALAPAVAHAEGASAPSRAGVAPGSADALVAPVPGGLTAAEAGRLARDTGPARRLDRAAIGEARARLSEARRLFFPRLTLGARYVRLSDFDPPTIGGGGSLVGTTAPPGTFNPPSVALGALSFPNILDQYSASISVAVPVSDYILRVRPAVEAAARGVEAAEHGARAAEQGANLAGQLAYLRWARALGAESAAREAERDARSHLTDASNLEAAGLVSRVDVLRAEAGVAAAELGVAQATSFVALSARELRTRLHLAEEAPLRPGDALDLGSEPPDLPAREPLVAEALASRPELRALAATEARLRAATRAAHAASLPSAALFGEALYANPNPRSQPQSDRWLGTWAAGVSVTWAVHELVASGPATEVLRAQLAQVEARGAELRDDIALQVEDARQAILRADAAVRSGQRELASSREALRVAQDLYRVGRASSVVLTDAEAGLARARLLALDAQIERRSAWARLRHALGRPSP